jgi:hypothetical protein
MRCFLAGLLAMLVGGGCTGGPPEAVRPVAKLRPLVQSVAALCEAQTAHSPARARHIFLNRSHEALHTLAKRAGKRDRAVAARVLEAMERVEAEVDAEATSRVTKRDMGRLRRAAERALVVVGLRPLPCRSRLS